MKRKILAAAAAVALGMFVSATKAANVLLGQVKLTQGSYSFGQGGEFTATETSGAGWATNTTTQNMPPALASAGQFQTFCIEAGVNEVDFNPGTIYDATLIDQSASGLGRLTLNINTAALYGAFSRGALAGYDYTNSGAGRQASAGALQYAIWIAQGDAGGAYTQAIEGNGLHPTGQFTAAEFTSALGILQGYGYGTLTGAEATLAYQFYTEVLSLNYISLFAANTAVIALGNPVDSAQAQLVEGSVTPHVGPGTPLPSTAVAGFSLFAGLAGFEVLRKRQAKLQLV